MALGDQIAYTDFTEQLGRKTHALQSGGDTLRVALMTASYTPDRDANQVWADISANETAITNYARGTIASQSWTQDDANNRSVADGTDQTFSSLGPGTTPAWAVVYNDTPTSPADPLICYMDLAGAPTPNGFDWTINWHATNGILTVTAS